MFQEIRIHGVGVIDDALLELSPGLNVVTGETGAGKTMVVSGLGLLLGARADSGLVRSGTDAAVVEGVLALPEGHPARERAADAGADVRGDLVLARTLTREGRSRAHVGGRSAPVGLLSELGEMLVAVHGQADQWRLRHAEQHREVLDSFGGDEVARLLAAYQETFDALGAATRERERLRQLSRERSREVDMLQTGLERIEALEPRAGEDADLRAEDERLAHADGLCLAAEQAYAALAGEDPQAVDLTVSVRDRLADARSAMAPMTEHDSALRDLDRRAAELSYLVADLAGDLASYLSDVDIDPGRLAVVQQRRADLSALTRSYGDTVDDVLAWAKEAATKLLELLGAEDRVEELERETARLRGALSGRAEALRTARRRAGADFGDRVSRELGHLAMGTARVRVAVTSRPDPEGLRVGGEAVRFGRNGVDDVELLLAANPGTPARSVARAASGGELSRVMLALEVVSGASDGGSVPTFVFDEVDAGVGGRAAVDVGARLAALARHSQVIVVTHLAQVAVFADRHLVVRKDDDGRVTSSSVREVTGQERLGELSRMMGGDGESVAGLEHARELLDQSATIRTRQAAAVQQPGKRSASRRATATPSG